MRFRDITRAGIKNNKEVKVNDERLKRCEKIIVDAYDSVCGKSGKLSKKVLLEIIKYNNEFNIGVGDINK